jgi:signal transduction histidine kinase
MRSPIIDVVVDDRGVLMTSTKPQGARWAVSGAVFLVLISVAWLGLRVSLPGDGAPWRQDPGFRSGVTIDAAPADSGLRGGDVVTAVDGAGLDHWLAGAASDRPRLDAGVTLAYRVRRRGVMLDVPVRVYGSDPVWPRLRHAGGVGIAAIALLLIGGFAVRRRAEHPAAHALLLFGAGLLTAFTFTAGAPWEVAHLVTTRWMFVLGMAAAVPAFAVTIAALAHLTIAFPLPPQWLVRRGWLIGILYGGTLASTSGALLVYLLVGRPTMRGLQTWYTASNYVLSALAALALAGVVRMAFLAAKNQRLRTQIGTVGIALAVTVLGLLLLNLVIPETPGSPWIVGLLFLPLPTVIAASLLRGEFLDIRATLNRALVYIVTTGLLLGVYVGLVELVAAAANRTGIVSTLPATAVVAILFAPLRARVQRGVEGLLYGDRGQPAHVLATLGARLQVAVPPGEILSAITDTIATTLRLPYVALTLAGDPGSLACERGEPPGRIEQFPLIQRGEIVGELLVGVRAGQHRLAASDRALLADLAPHLSATVHATALVTELAANRTRLAVAREDERAQLRQDLHDRLGSRLVGLSLQLDATARSAEGSPLAGPLARLSDDIAATLVEVRRLSRGLRPAELDELGLVAAIRAAVTRLTIEDDAATWHPDVTAAVHMPFLTADVEAAAYQIAVEAMTNSYRHSGGNHAHVRIAVDPSSTKLVVEIADDGHGIDQSPNGGIGIRSMHERASAVGGSLRITSPNHSGALVRAELPLAVPAASVKAIPADRTGT